MKEGEDIVGGWNGVEVEVGKIVAVVVDKEVEEEGGKTEGGGVDTVRFKSWLSNRRADPVVVIFSNKSISK